MARSLLRFLLPDSRRSAPPFLASRSFLQGLGEGKAFSAKDFLDIASRGTIDMALAGLTRDGKIRRIRRGLYHMPKVNPKFGGKLSPDIDEAARAIARRQRWKIVTHPAG